VVRGRLFDALVTEKMGIPQQLIKPILCQRYTHKDMHALKFIEFHYTKSAKWDI